jgi:DNA adenine methylase
MKPFVKWLGGKRQIIDRLTNGLPEYCRYFEPFVGGGALLFELKPKKATISDINCDLINCYKIIRDDVNGLITFLSDLQKGHCEKQYYEVRSWNCNEGVQRAARLIYLNKTCFNGLYRENRKGQFNAAYGKYENPRILDEDNLKLVSEYFNGNDIKIVHGSYAETIKEVKAGDLVYLDPPYYPLNQISFVRYNKEVFCERNQLELAAAFKNLTDLGVHVMLSNSNTEFINNLYESYSKETLAANRTINTKGDGRKKDKKIEIIIRNWNYESDTN